jgi:hypothetical protein
VVFNAIFNNISVISWRSKFEKCDTKIWLKLVNILLLEGHRGRDHIVVGFTTTYAISSYHH